MPFNPSQTDFHQLVKESVKKYYTAYEQAEKISISIKGNERLVWVDGTITSHILDNLISNALKYSEGKPAPEVTLEYEDESFQVIVEDYGIGIPEDELNHLGESFFRAKNALNIPGTGLGLVLVDNFIQMHQGSARWDNKPTGGVKVILNFPQNQF